MSGSYSRILWAVVASLVVLALPLGLSAQYFGQNKVRYETFDFKILKTERFDIYYYDEEREAAAQVGAWRSAGTRG